MSKTKKRRIKPRAAKTQENVVQRKATPSSVVGIGASAGGLEAFEQFLKALPADTGMAFVIVQHLSPRHESLLRALLAGFTRMPVIEVSDGDIIKANSVYVIPPNADMTVVKGSLHLSPRNSEGSRRLPIDEFFRSLAEDQQSRAVGIVLSGSASDGTLGLHAIKAAGGITFAQAVLSARFSGMPKSAIASGNVDFVMPPGQIAAEVARIASHGYGFPSPDNEPRSPQSAGKDVLGKIFDVLRSIYGVDFSYYKPGTIKRRIVRRLFLRKIESLGDYLPILRKDKDELETLFNDLLINVTGFFRDSEAFDALRKQGLPLLLKSRHLGSPLRIWVPGCSTGEEAYSLAILLVEELGDQIDRTPIQIFSTDVSEAIIQRARMGVYSESISVDVSKERLKKFFIKMDGVYQIQKKIRDMCVFAKQDLAKDPPFSKLDMISCRNVMIYLAPVLQKRIIPTFHYALNPRGILFLGSSESIGGFEELFTPVDKKQKIYSRKAGLSAMDHLSVPPLIDRVEVKASKESTPMELDLKMRVEEILLSRYVPGCVVIDEKHNIVQFIGQTGRFLQPAPGNASLNILKMVKSGLHHELRIALQKVGRGQSVRREGILIEDAGSFKAVNFEVFELNGATEDNRYYLVVFEDGARLVDEIVLPTAKQAEQVKPGKKKPVGKPIDNSRLQEELDATREYLQSIIEEQKATNEELRSANEEIQSSNEELQSINEELETAKEELQSTNEELTTVNDELRTRNDELMQLNNDLSNLLSSVNIPIIMLGNDLRIRRFTPLAEKIMNLIPTDVGRPITDISPNLKWPELRQSIMKVIDTLEIQEIEVEDRTGRWYSMRIRPYRTIDNKIDGVVIVILDLDTRLLQAKSK